MEVGVGWSKSREDLSYLRLSLPPRPRPAPLTSGTKGREEWAPARQGSPRARVEGWAS